MKYEQDYPYAMEVTDESAFSGQADVPTAVPAPPDEGGGGPQHYPPQATHLQGGEPPITLLPRAPDLIYVESYYGPRSMMASILLFLVFPPCAILPCVAPCDSERGIVSAVTYAPSGYPRRRLYVRIPENASRGQMLTTTTPDGFRVNFLVPNGVRPGTRVQIEC